jgi:hypothetical protein
VEEVIRQRHLDPLRATEAEAALRFYWFEHRHLDAESRKLLLPGELNASFEDWAAAQLSDLGLIEAEQMLDESLRFLDRNEGRLPTDVGGRAQLDRAALGRMLAAVRREAAYRDANLRGRAAISPETELAPDLLALLKRHATTTIKDLLATEAGRQQHLAVLTNYVERTLFVTPLEQRMTELALAGHRADIEPLERDAEAHREWMTEYQSDIIRSELTENTEYVYSLRELTKDQQRVYREAGEALSIQGARLDASLEGLLAKCVDQVTDLKSRIHAALAGIPPSSGLALNGAAAPYADAILLKERGRYADRMRTLVGIKRDAVRAREEKRREDQLAMEAARLAREEQRRQDQLAMEAARRIPESRSWYEGPRDSSPTFARSTYGRSGFSLDRSDDGVLGFGAGTSSFRARLGRAVPGARVVDEMSDGRAVYYLGPGYDEKRFMIDGSPYRYRRLASGVL